MKRFLYILLLLGPSLSAQPAITLEEAIGIAHNRSSQIQVVRLSFMSRYWNYRSYKAQLLPSLRLNGTVANYNRSLVQVQDYNSGEIQYVTNNMMSNSLWVSLIQNIPFTGGTLSLNTNLYRLDQFSNDMVTYNSNPITINYTQPLRAYNELKWQKRTAPREYEQAKRNLLESAEELTITTTSLFFNVLNAQTNYEEAANKAADNKKLYTIAQQRFDVGKITKSELLQLELSMLNSDLAINDNRVVLDMTIYELCAYLGIAETTSLKLIPPMDIPDIQINSDQVLDLSLRNSSFRLGQELKQLNADKGVEQAKSQQGLQATFSANLGFSQSAEKLSSVYKDLKDQEIVSVTLSMPIFDWGMNRGRVKMAQAQARLAQTEIKQEELKFRQDLLIKVLKFNNQARQCELSRKAMMIADERYRITYQRFENGSITVTDLNTAQSEQKSALNQYINQLGIYWNSYYELRKFTLYDFIAKQDLSAEFDKIIE